VGRQRKILKVGDLVEYAHWEKVELLTPDVRVGVIIIGPNEVGKVRVMFGDRKMWVWTGDLRLLSSVK